MPADLNRRSSDSTGPAASDPAVAALLFQWLQQAQTTPIGSRTAAAKSGGAPAHRWIASLLATVSQSLSGAAVGLCAQVGQRWQMLAQHGTPSISISESLIAQCLEQHGPASEKSVIAVAIHDGKELHQADTPTNASLGLSPTVLIAQLPASDPARTKDACQRLSLIAEALHWIDRLQRDVHHSSATAGYLRQLLDVSLLWHHIDNTDQLLEAIASTATEMLGAERASIFLWDKRRGKLIGRPALGVEGGKLEVDDNAGIVGSVLATGQPRLWHVDEDKESEINRSVDKRLKFRTRSIAAVPLQSPTSGLCGVFEVINKHQGLFDQWDIVRLIDLASHAAAAIQGSETRQKLTKTRDRLLSDAASHYQVIGECPTIRALRETVSRVAKTDLAVLVLGENGTGKEVLARSLHFQSLRRDQPFVAVNCAALVETLLESELFGHERGAFTDAVQARPGKFELAHGGTLFLDEIGDMSPGGQAKLLRVLEEKIVVRVGGSTPIPVDVRIIAATNQSLPQLVAAKRFREDLFFRLNVVSLRLPALRERNQDVLLLAEHFLNQFAHQIGRLTPVLSDEAKQALLRHPWPGNVRELRNVMERSCYLSPSDILSEADLGLSVWDTLSLIHTSPAMPVVAPEQAKGSAAVDRTQSANISLADATRDFQVAHIEQMIDKHRGNMTSAAEALGLHRSNLYRKMRQLGMKTDDDEL